MLYREGMSGLVLLAAAGAVIIFVVAVKYAGTMFMDMPLGEAAVIIMLGLLLLGMLAVYCHRVKAARNVVLFYLGAAAVAWGLHLLAIDILARYFSRQCLPPHAYIASYYACAATANHSL